VSDVDVTELAVDAGWRERLVSVADLKAAVGPLHFPVVLHDTDQMDTREGDLLRENAGL
jgi:hypothetical protein